MRFLFPLALAGCLAFGAQAFAQATPAPKPAAAKSGASTPFAGFGSNSKEPIKIDANKLTAFDKESRAVYSGDVVAVQGQTTIRCTEMVIFYTQNKDQKGQKPAVPASSAPNAGQSSIKQIDCEGPVSVLSGTQSATSKRATYSAETDKVTLTGGVVMADGDNVQRGERVVYDVKTGIATVDAGEKGRVQGVFTPGSGDPKKDDAKKDDKTKDDKAKDDKKKAPKTN